MNRETNPRLKDTKNVEGKEAKQIMSYIKLNRNIYTYHIANPENPLPLLPLVHKSYARISWTRKSFMALIFQKAI